MATLKGVLAALRTAIQAADGTGSYTYDLSGTDTVILGEVIDAWKFPQVILFVDRVDIQPLELTTEQHTLTAHAVGYAAVTSDTASARLDSAADLAQDIHLALRADRSLGGTVIDVQRRSSVSVGESDTGDLFGVCDVQIVVQWVEEAT